MPQPAPHRVTSHCVTDSSSNDEPDQRTVASRNGNGARRREQVDSHARPPSSPPTTNCGFEIISPAHPVSGGQHQHARTMRSGVPGPWPGARRGWRDPHGCASEAGSHGSWHADGCSAGRYACSLEAPGESRYWGCRRSPPEASVTIDTRGHAAAAANHSAELRYVDADHRVKPAPGACGQAIDHWQRDGPDRERRARAAASGSVGERVCVQRLEDLARTC